MTPLVINLVLVAVLMMLLLQRAQRRFGTVAQQGLGFDDGTSVLAGYRLIDAPPDVKAERWETGTLTRDRAGEYLWTPGGSITAHRLGDLHPVDARRCGWWEGVWSLKTDWVVVRCAGIEGTGGAPFEVASSRPDLSRLPELARYAGTR